MLVNQMFNLNSHFPGRARTRRERLCFPSWFLLEQDWEQDVQGLQCPSTQSPGQGISHGCRTGGGSPEHWSLGTGSPVIQRAKQTFLLNASNQEKKRHCSQWFSYVIYIDIMYNVYLFTVFLNNTYSFPINKHIYLITIFFEYNKGNM